MSVRFTVSIDVDVDVVDNEVADDEVVDGKVVDDKVVSEVVDTVEAPVDGVAVDDER